MVEVMEILVLAMMLVLVMALVMVVVMEVTLVLAVGMVVVMVVTMTAGQNHREYFSLRVSRQGAEMLVMLVGEHQGRRTDHLATSVQCDDEAKDRNGARSKKALSQEAGRVGAS